MAYYFDFRFISILCTSCICDILHSIIFTLYSQKSIKDFSYFALVLRKRCKTVYYNYWFIQNFSDYHSKLDGMFTFGISLSGTFHLKWNVWSGGFMLDINYICLSVYIFTDKLTYFPFYPRVGWVSSIGGKFISGRGRGRGVAHTAVCSSPSARRTLFLPLALLVMDTVSLFRGFFRLDRSGLLMLAASTILSFIDVFGRKYFGLTLF